MQKGFTLLEIIVTITISSTIILILTFCMIIINKQYHNNLIINSSLSTALDIEKRLEELLDYYTGYEISHNEQHFVLAIKNDEIIINNITRYIMEMKDSEYYYIFDIGDKHYEYRTSDLFQLTLINNHLLKLSMNHNLKGLNNVLNYESYFYLGDLSYGT